MWFRVIGPICEVETIAAGGQIRELGRLRRLCSEKRWRKLEGTATVELEDGSIHLAELHWYEAHVIGRQEMKIKRFCE